MKFPYAFIVITLVSSLITGCGVPQEKFDAAISERETLKTQAASVQGDLEEAQAEIARLQEELSPLKTGVSNLEKQLFEAKTQSTNLKKESAALKRINIITTDFCESRPDSKTGNHTIKPNSTYKVGETVWYYIEFIGTKYLMVNDKCLQHVVVSIDAYDEKGDLFDKYAYTDESTVNNPYAYTRYTMEYSGMTAGNYTVEIVVEDKLSGETATEKGSFTVVS